MKLRTKAALVAVGIVGIVGLLALNRREDESLGAVASRPATVVTPDASPRSSVETPNTREDEAACAGQTLHVRLDNSTHDLCVSDTRADQNGAIRTWRVDSIDGTGRWLRIDTAGGKVLSATLGGGISAQFQCKDDACSGITIGRHDVQGVRTISLEEAPLKRAGLDSAAAGSELARVSGTLKTLPQEQMASLACAGEGVSIVTSDSSSQAFCPKGGAGFEIADNGHRTYRFTNLDGASILVVVDQSENVREVRFEGDDRLSCRGAACGVRISAPTAQGERFFEFAGTTLIENRRGESNAVVNGTLVLPAL
jgi:hypothetical protein